MVRFFGNLVVIFLSATVANAQAQVTLTMDHLKLSELIHIMRSEGLEYAATLNIEMLNGQGSAVWEDQIGAIYDTQLMSEVVRKEIATIPENQLRQINQFYGSNLGAKIVDLEIAARIAMTDNDIRNIAEDNYQIALAQDPKSLLQVNLIVSEGDLIERNVTAALTSNYRFYLGLVDGGSFDASEQEVIEQTWEQEDEIRLDTVKWMMGYLLLSYQSLDEAEMIEFINFMKTRAGRALNAAIFDGFGAMYGDISYTLGRAVALNIVVPDL
jgi:hypothetical protein